MLIWVNISSGAFRASVSYCSSSIDVGTVTDEKDSLAH